MRLFAVSALVAASLAAPAQACRVDGSSILRPTPPTALPKLTELAVVRADVRGFAPGGGAILKKELNRGYLAGNARITEVMNGRAPRSVLPLYLETVTSCSYFSRGEARKIEATGVLVGQVLTDQHGIYMRVVEDARSELMMLGEAALF